LDEVCDDVWDALCEVDDDRRESWWVWEDFGCYESVVYDDGFGLVVEKVEIYSEASLLCCYS